MSAIDLMINFIESVLFALMSERYIYISTEKKRVLCFLLLTIALFIYISFFTAIYVYEGLNSILYSVVIFAILLLFQDKERPLSKANIFIYCFILNILVSVSTEIILLFLCPITGLSPGEISESVWLIPAFLVSRSIIVAVILLMRNHARKYQYYPASHQYLFMFSFFVINYIVTVLEGRLYENDPPIIQICVINILIFSITFVLYLSYCETAYANYKQNQKDMLSTQLSSLDTTTQVFKVKEAELRSIKHDLINQFTVLNAYLEQGDINKSKEIIREYICQLDTMPVITHTGYIAIDAILTTKLNNAKSSGIHTFSAIQLPELTHEEEYDIALILGNLLDNAIENINEKDRDIRLIVKSKDHIVIRVENTTDRAEMPEGTSKTDHNNHGFGLNNIRTIAQIHNGFLTYDLNDGVFTAVVVLNR
ncbi:MAG: sensor histidine kinase [Solobacterium sp.]|nr:sensor histidine kinase [Solobacterium sp.]